MEDVGNRADRSDQMSEVRSRFELIKHWEVGTITLVGRFQQGSWDYRMNKREETQSSSNNVNRVGSFYCRQVDLNIYCR
nr:hypothetical protein Q903MT_gene3627 [Picea sitchensis]